MRWAIVALLLVVGCGNGEPAVQDEPAPTQPPTEAAATPPTLSELAAQIGCEPEPRDELIAREAGGCEYAGGTLRLVTFSSAEQQANWLEAVQTVGSGVQVMGELWAANCSSMEVAQQVQTELGGEIR